MLLLSLEEKPPEPSFGKRFRETFTGAIGDFAILKYFLNLKESISLWSLVTKGLVFRDVLVDINKVNSQLERLWTKYQDPNDSLNLLPPICLKHGKVHKLQLSVSIARGSTTVCVNGFDAIFGFAPQYGSASLERNMPRFVSNLNSVSSLLRAVLLTEEEPILTSCEGWKQRAINFWLKYDPRVSIRVKDVHVWLEDDFIGRWGITANSLILRTRDVPKSHSPGIKDARVEFSAGVARIYWSRHPFSEGRVPFDAINIIKQDQISLCLDGELSRPSPEPNMQSQTRLTEPPGFIEKFQVTADLGGPFELHLAAEILAALDKLSRKLKLASAAARLYLPFQICEPFRTPKRHWKWLKECLLLSRRKEEKSIARQIDSSGFRGVINKRRCCRQEALLRKANRVLLQNMKALWAQTIISKIQSERRKEDALENFVQLITTKRRVSGISRQGTMAKMGSSLARLLSSSFPRRQVPVSARPLVTPSIDEVAWALLHPPLQRSGLETFSSRLAPCLSLSLASHSDKTAVAQVAIVALWEVTYTLRILFEALKKLKSDQAVHEFSRAHPDSAVLSSVDFAVWTALNKPTRIVTTHPVVPIFAPNALIHIWASFIDQMRPLSKERLDILVHSCVNFFDLTPPTTVAWKPSIIKPQSGHSLRYSERLLLGNRLLLRSLITKRIRPHLKKGQRLLEFDLVHDLALALKPSEIAPCILHRTRQSMTERSELSRASVHRPDAFLKEAEQVLKKALWSHSDPFSTTDMSSCGGDDETIGTSCRALQLRPNFPAPNDIPYFKPFVLRSTLCGSTSARVRFSSITIFASLSPSLSTRFEIGNLVVSANMERKVTMALAAKSVSGSLLCEQPASFYIGRVVQSDSSSRPGGRMLSASNRSAVGNDRLAVTVRLTMTPANLGKSPRLELAPPLAISLTLSLNDVTYNDSEIVPLTEWISALYKFRIPGAFVFCSSETRRRLHEICLGRTAARCGFYRVRLRLPSILSPADKILVAGRRICVDTGKISGVRAYRVTVDNKEEKTIPQGEEGLLLVQQVSRGLLVGYVEEAEKMRSKKI